MNTLDDGDSDSSSPLDFGVADVITTTIVYLTCTVVVYVLCTYVEHAVDEPDAPDGTGTPAAAPPAASVTSETPLAGTRAGGYRAPTSRPSSSSHPQPPTHTPAQSRPTPPDAADHHQRPAETGGDASRATVPEDMGREKRRR